MAPLRFAMLDLREEFQSKLGASETCQDISGFEPVADIGLVVLSRFFLNRMLRKMPLVH